jgi:RNA polymerase sigma factor (sigma-70 family)
VSPPPAAAAVGAAPSTPPLDSAALARAIAAGDEAAFTAFYRAWFAPALALARAASRRDEAWCLDVVQDVMLAVARRLPPLRDERAVRAWLATAVGHAVTDRVRAEQARRRRERAVAEQLGAIVAPEPWLELAADERVRWLAEQVTELGDADRALLAARFGDALSVAAAGAAFGLSADGAHGRLRRVLERLRNAATEWWHGG